MLILILSLKYLIGINYVYKSESLMSFQETLVSKSKKKKKKHSKCTKPKTCKKNKDCHLSIFITTTIEIKIYHKNILK
jgi:hypothetical protein